MTDLTLDRPRSIDLATADDVVALLEPHRISLTGYCYRMLGSAFEAEDAVQETLVRAWRAIGTFEGRAALRSWLYRIATNVCLDMLGARQRRARPMDLGPAGRADIALLGQPLAEGTWVEPIADASVVPTAGDPADIAVARETVRLAFVAALQHLPPRQRAVLILREVLHWKAAEVAELLGTTSVSVNSLLQRARATLATVLPEGAEPPRPEGLDARSRELLERYVDAFERYDMDALTALLREDASWSMPPYALWLHTHRDIVDWCLGPGIGCDGSRLVPVQVNGTRGFGQYKPDPAGGWMPWAIQVLDLDGERIEGVMFFLDTPRWFPLFGLPDHLD